MNGEIPIKLLCTIRDSGKDTMVVSIISKLLRKYDGVIRFIVIRLLIIRL
jgi:hypothetical protein